MYVSAEVTDEVTEYFSKHLAENSTDYACIYGSSVYDPEKRTSDIDLFVVSRKLGLLALEPTIDFIQKLHEHHGRNLDAEVPYSNKLLYTESEIEAAVQFSGFDIVGGRIVVPPIKKTCEFLGGAAIKSRLALNSLTTPHYVIGNDLSRYNYARERAGVAITLLAANLQNEEDFNIDTLFSSLVKNPDGESGEMYLGYKTEYPIVQEHLYSTLDEGLDRLYSDNVVKKSGEIYCVDRNTFNPLEYMKAIKQEA